MNNESRRKGRCHEVRINVFRFIKCLMIVVLVIMSICACSNSDPILGTYKAARYESAGGKVACSGYKGCGEYTIKLKKNGKLNIKGGYKETHTDADLMITSMFSQKVTSYIGADEADMEWSIDGEKFHAEGDGLTFDGTLSDGIMILEFPDGSTLKLEKS